MILQIVITVSVLHTHCSALIIGPPRLDYEPTPDFDLQKVCTCFLRRSLILSLKLGGPIDEALWYYIEYGYRYECYQIE